MAASTFGASQIPEDDSMNDMSTPASAGDINALVGDVIAVRQLIRAGTYTGETSALVPGIVQGNVAILPEDWADEFLLFCHRNPKPCTPIAVSEPGNPKLPELGDDIDVRTDVPAYRIFQNGEPVAEVTDLHEWWRDDLVTFVLGCSFSFEQALIEAGLRIRHRDIGATVPMYRTNISTSATHRFSGPTVVSMRPFTPADAIRAIQVTSRFPSVHGAPIHLGDPTAIGIVDIARPDYGDAVEVRPGEIPVFWACGVTPQAVIENARPSLCITHRPGSMLISNLPNSALATF